MIRGNDIQFDADQNALLVQKKAIPVQVEFAKANGVCDTKEGKVSYKFGDAIMTGMEGEQWPIERKKFDETYDPIASTRTGENGSYTKKPIMVHALQMDEPFYVIVSWADDRLEGQQGDWLLQYGADDYGVVSKTIFEKTYEIIS